MFNWEKIIAVKKYMIENNKANFEIEPQYYTNSIQDIENLKEEYNQKFKSNLTLNEILDLKVIQLIV